MRQDPSCAGYNLALSAWVCGGANLIGFAIATVTKTHYITDLIVRPYATCLHPQCMPAAPLGPQQSAAATYAHVQGCGTFTVAAWATQIAAMHGNNMSAFSYHRPLFLTIATTFWSVRLAGFLFYRVLCTKGDKCDPLFYHPSVAVRRFGRVSSSAVDPCMEPCSTLCALCHR